MSKEELLKEVKARVDKGEGLVSIGYYLTKIGVQEPQKSEVLQSAQGLIEAFNLRQKKSVQIDWKRFLLGAVLLVIGLYYIKLGRDAGRIAIWSLGLALSGGILVVVELLKLIVLLVRSRMH